jgi:hypothetical protein
LKESQERALKDLSKAWEGIKSMSEGITPARRRTLKTAMNTAVTKFNEAFRTAELKFEEKSSSGGRRRLRRGWWQ